MPTGESDIASTITPRCRGSCGPGTTVADDRTPMVRPRLFGRSGIVTRRVLKSGVAGVVTSGTPSAKTVISGFVDGSDRHHFGGPGEGEAAVPVPFDAIQAADQPRRRRTDPIGVYRRARHIQQYEPRGTGERPQEGRGNDSPYEHVRLTRPRRSA